MNTMFPKNLVRLENGLSKHSLSHQTSFPLDLPTKH